MTWEDVAQLVVLMFSGMGSMLFLGAGIKWIERRWLK